MNPHVRIRSERGREAQGREAGVVSRSLANTLDLGVAWIITFVILSAWSVFRYIVFNDPLVFPRPGVSLTIGLYWAVLVLYLADGWDGGKSIGKRIVGLRVEAVHGDARGRRWLARAVVSVVAWPVMMGSVALSRDNRGLHDRLFRTRVVYDWSRH